MVHAINSNQSSTIPAQNPDGTLTAIVSGPIQSLGDGQVLSIVLPGGLVQDSVFATYFLVRCGASTGHEREQYWQFYFRRALFAISCNPIPPKEDGSRQDQWQLFIPTGDNPGLHWLAQQTAGTSLNLMGPFGHNLELPSSCRNLFLIAEPRNALLLLPLITAMLDRGGRVTLLLSGDTDTRSFLVQLPIAVEVHTAKDADSFFYQLADILPWCDMLVGAVPHSVWQRIADTIRARRFVLEPGFAHILVEADLLCGFGACLACVIPLSNDSLTRACIHGPIFDLTALTRKP